MVVPVDPLPHPAPNITAIAAPATQIRRVLPMQQGYQVHLTNGAYNAINSKHSFQFKEPD